MIKIVPTSGLANRMRAIDSALALAASMGRALTVAWVRDELMNCRFGDLFEPLGDTEVVELSRLPISCKDARINNLFIPGILRRMKGEHYIPKSLAHRIKGKDTDFQSFVNGKPTIIVSNVRFYQNPTAYARFIPVERIQNLIRHEAESFDDHTIGMHIRRTDNKKSIAQSPLSLFEDKIEEEIRNNPKANFYLASDCRDTKLHLLGKYPGRISTNTTVVSRRTKEDAERAVTELYALSRTRKVYGSYWSSFSETACDISGIENITVMRQEPLMQ